MLVRPFEDGDRAAVAALAQAEDAGPGVSGARLLVMLCEEAQHGWVAVDRDQVLGVIGRLRGAGQQFLYPLVCAEPSAAQALVTAALDDADQPGVPATRASTFTLTSARAHALAAHGFAPIFEFIDFQAQAGGLASPALPPGFVVEAFARGHTGDLMALYNATFEGVPNALPMTEAQMAEQQIQAGLDDQASVLIRDAQGAAVGFMMALTADDGLGPALTVDTIGVARTAQRTGLATWMVHSVMCRAAELGLPHVRALIASTNLASMRLHEGLGFTPRRRRTVWERQPRP